LKEQQSSEDQMKLQRNENSAISKQAEIEEDFKIGVKK
jgi:hypothetical protein